MIAHLSISAADPERVAQALAEIWQGKAFPFPPFPESWIAFADDARGTAIEVYPVGHTLKPGTKQVQCESGGDDRRVGATHVAIRTPWSQIQIETIAKREGWPLQLCDRGPFRCLELWVENRTLVEVLTSEMDRDYVRTMTPDGWQLMFKVQASRILESKP